MSPYRRNIIVGSTVLVAMILLGWMIIRFGGNLGTAFAGDNYGVKFKTERADGLSEGSAIFYRGVSVGKVIHVTLDTNQRDVYVDGVIEQKFTLPGNLQATIKQTSLLGSGSSIVLETTGTDIVGTLKDGASIDARFAGLDFFPPEIKSLSTEITATAKQWREADVIGNLNKVLTEAQKTINSVNQIVADDKLKDDIHSSVTNLRTTLETADKVAKSFEAFTIKLNTVADNAQSRIQQVGTVLDKTDVRLDDLAKQTSARMEEVSKLLAQAQEIAIKVNTGNGSAGKLINDPRLYESLVDTSTKLNDTVKDLQRLVQQWEQEGVTIKIR